MNSYSGQDMWMFFYYYSWWCHIYDSSKSKKKMKYIHLYREGYSKNDVNDDDNELNIDN